MSGGQRQRIVIALAMLVRPVLLVADEPTTALDLSTQAQVLRLLRDLVDDKGLAMLLTTHDPGVAYEICDRVAVMYGGQLGGGGGGGNGALQRPAHPYMRRLLAARTRLRGSGAALPGSAPSPFAQASRPALSIRAAQSAKPDASVEIPPPSPPRRPYPPRCWKTCPHDRGRCCRRPMSAKHTDGASIPPSLAPRWRSRRASRWV